MRHLLPMNEFERAIVYFACGGRCPAGGGGHRGADRQHHDERADDGCGDPAAVGSSLDDLLVLRFDVHALRVARLPPGTVSFSSAASTSFRSPGADRVGAASRSCSNTLLAAREAADELGARIARDRGARSRRGCGGGRPRCLEVGIRGVGHLEDDPERLREALPDAQQAAVPDALEERLVEAHVRLGEVFHARRRRPPRLHASTCRPSSATSSASKRSRRARARRPRASGAGGGAPRRPPRSAP